MKASLNQAAYLFVAPLSQAARTIDALRQKVEAGSPATAEAAAEATAEPTAETAEESAPEAAPGEGTTEG